MMREVCVVYMCVYAHACIFAGVRNKCSSSIDRTGNVSMEYTLELRA